MYDTKLSRLLSAVLLAGLGAGLAGCVGNGSSEGLEEESRAATAGGLELGVMHEKVACREDPGTHYNLYLPSAYTPEKQWPVMLVFSPGGNAGLGLYRETAEELGWILAGCVECRNGPEEPIIRHRDALFRDLVERFSVHPHRLYASGFSGGARVSFGTMYTYSDWFDGIIPICGGEYAGVGERREMPWASIYGFTGETDMNNGEMRELQQELSDNYVVQDFVLEEFAGGHENPPQRLIARAMRWLEDEFRLKVDRHVDSDYMD